MAEQLKAGPMIVEKQTVLYVRSRGALTRGASGYSSDQGHQTTAHASF